MQACLFDIDGTLLSSGGAGRAAMEAALREEFGLAELRGKVEFSGRTDRAIGHDLLRLHGFEASPENWRRLLSAYLRLLPEALPRHQGQVLPGVIELLEHLRGREGVAIGLLTGNVREGARLKLSHYGIEHHFRFGGFGDEHFDRDDVARATLEALRGRLDGELSLDRIWVIGDTPLDVRCARCIGVRVAAVATGWHSRDELAASGPDLLLEDLSDPSPLLRAWS